VRWSVGRLAAADRNARLAWLGNHRASSDRLCAFVFDTRARVVNIGVQEKRKISGAMEPRNLAS
jgi:hypothetical protein